MSLPSRIFRLADDPKPRRCAVPWGVCPEPGRLRPNNVIALCLSVAAGRTRGSHSQPGGGVCEKPANPGAAVFHTVWGCFLHLTDLLTFESQKVTFTISLWCLVTQRNPPISPGSALSGASVMMRTETTPWHSPCLLGSGFGPPPSCDLWEVFDVATFRWGGGGSY